MSEHHTPDHEQRTTADLVRRTVEAENRKTASVTDGVPSRATPDESRNDDENRTWAESQFAAIAGVTDGVPVARAEDESRNGRWSRLAQARKDASICAKCGAAIAPDAPVNIRSVGLRRRWTDRDVPGPVAECCWDEWDRRWMEPRWTRPCNGCGRMVSGSRNCSDRCRDRAQARRKRERRKAARAGRVCDGCGTALNERRAGSRYCSNACRQKAYRARVALA